MDRMLYIIAIVILTLWIIGYFGFHISGVIHILLFVGLLIIIIRLIKNRKVF